MTGPLVVESYLAELPQEAICSSGSHHISSEGSVVIPPTGLTRPRTEKFAVQDTLAHQLRQLWVRNGAAAS